MNLAFKHSGRLGDIIYSLPYVKRMSELQNQLAAYYVCNDTPARIGRDVFHPSLDVMVNAGMFEYVEPLISAQKYIKNFLHVPSAGIPKETIDLDAFKSSGLNLKAGLIQGWYRKTFGMPFALEEPWLFVEQTDLESNALPSTFVEQKEIARWPVLISRTTRFCNTKINYQFLDQIAGVGFIGLDYEYQDFIQRYSLKNITHVKVRNALELAMFMSRSLIFIGNQSSNFAIAEGLKITRALEAFEPVPVATPVGGLCFEYTNTQFLVNFVSQILSVPLHSPPDKAFGEYHESIKAQAGYQIPLKKRIKNAIKNIKTKRYL